jgi:hypothetical protein
MFAAFCFQNASTTRVVAMFNTSVCDERPVLWSRLPCRRHERSRRNRGGGVEVVAIVDVELFVFDTVVGKFS